ncbi:rhodanese-like domain-containing protein [Paradesulfitobacterium aromaticivorans]
MRNKKLYSLLSLLVILGLLVSGCGQSTTPTATTPSSTSTPSTTAPAEDAAKAVKTAVVSYFNNIPTVGDSYKISEDKLKSELEQNAKAYLVLDIRKADEYAKGHIQGAVNVPFGKDIADNLDKIRAASKDKTVIVACYTGQTAGQTVSVLNVAGIKTRSLHGGMGNGINYGWLAKKFPTVTEATAMPQAAAVESPNKDIDKAVKDYFNNMPADSYKIDDPALKDELAKNADKYLVVDIRQAKDFDAGHIKGAINVPYGADLGTKLDSLIEQSKGKTLVVYCYTGQTAGQADSLFNLVGITAKSLNFGMGNKDLPKSWAGLGYEVIK